MGKYDVLMGKYFSNRERFADLFNGILFDGERMIIPDSLEREAGDYLQTEETKIRRRYRDLKMKSGQEGQFQIFSLENQSFVDYTMPLRCMEYDFLEYLEQLNKLKESYKITNTVLRGAEKLCGIRKEDRLLPVYTICLYLGEEKWDGPRSLWDMVRLSGEQKVKQHFSDYSMRLYCINEQQNFEVFHTEVRQFFQALIYRKNKEKLEELIENSTEYQNLSEETFEVIVNFLGMPKLWKIREQFKSINQKGGYNMCQAIREWSAEEREIGRGIGLAEGIEQGIEKGLERGLEQGLERMIVDNLEERKPEEIIIKKLMRHFSLGEQQAKMYYDKYAKAVV